MCSAEDHDILPMTVPISGDSASKLPEATKPNQRRKSQQPGEGSQESEEKATFVSWGKKTWNYHK